MHTKKLSKLGGVSLISALSLVGAVASTGSATAVSHKAKGPTSLPISSFTSNFSVMKTLKSLTAAGHGKIAAILPDTVSSTRYVEFDAPDIRRALLAAGVPSSQFVIQNALGSDATELTQAQTDITNGATVLLMDPLDSGVGGQIETYAAAHGVKVIDYDRLTLGGKRSYYVSFNNVTVGRLIGQGFVSCVAAWHVKKPQVIVMHGAATDNNATLFAAGYNSVLAPYFAHHGWKDVANTADTWDPPTAATEFEAAYTAHPNVNSAVMPNDETAAPIITYLKTLHVKAKTFPTTGQDATLTGLDNVLTNYQCGTVYKPVYLEAGAAVALALYLRAGQTPPSNLVNGTTADTTSHVNVKSILMKPIWVTRANMKSTVVKDKFVPTSSLCAAPYTGACRSAGIKA